MDLISKAKLQNIAAEKGFNLIYLEKDYFLTVLLYFLRNGKKIPPFLQGLMQAGKMKSLSEYMFIIKAISRKKSALMLT
ncbi:MAG: hypothetical protein HZB66_03255 [Candidatus Aenigmarchaeota archaeon]|nr:hypothetical protein [Candidatus Aenigmarchaeota archaeon]